MWDLDTDTLTLWLRGQSAVVERVEAHDPDELGITIITVLVAKMFPARAPETARAGACAPQKSLSTVWRKFDDVCGSPFRRRLRCSLLTDRLGYARRSRLVCAKNSLPRTSPNLRHTVLRIGALLLESVFDVAVGASNKHLVPGLAPKGKRRVDFHGFLEQSARLERN
jgi:hypothetical protein